MVLATSEKRTQITIPQELEAEMTPAVRAFVEVLLMRIESLETEVAELKRRLGMTPQNSSLPSSSEHPHAKQTKPKRKPSGRKRGGQARHKKHQRTLVPPEQVTETITLRPPKCRRCGGKLRGIDPQPLRHQVFELPEIKPIITEYQLKRCGEKLFHHWHRYRDGTITRGTMKRNIRKLWWPVYEALEDGTLKLRGKQAGMCQHILDRVDHLWTFLHHEDVEPTNNASERSLRHAVIWRKLPFGTQSASGSRFVETLLSVIETCRRQNRSVFTFVTEALAAHFNAHPAPKLLMMSVV